MRKEFIFIIGGSGVGKNYYYEQSKYKELYLIDLDEIVTPLFEARLQNNSLEAMETARDEAIKIARQKMEYCFENNKSFVRIGTGANMVSTSNRLKWAKF